MPRLLHISDVHFGPYHAPVLSDAVVELVEQQRPDAVLLSGDLTQRAKPEQFRAARGFVDRLAAPTLVVPGNHDVPLYRFWERVLQPFGAYRRHFHAELEPLLQVEGLYVVGINSAHGWTFTDGRIPMRRLVQLSDELAAAPPDACKVVVMHHPIVPPPLLAWPRAVDNAREAAQVMTEGGVELVIAGHIHQTYLTTLGAFFAGPLPGVRVVHTGTTSSRRGRWQERGRSSLNWISIDEDAIGIAPHVWDLELERFEEMSRHRFPRRPIQTLTAGRVAEPARRSVAEVIPDA